MVQDAYWQLYANKKLITLSTFPFFTDRGLVVQWGHGHRSGHRFR